MHDHKEVITAPLGVAHNELGHDRINFLNHVHAEEFFQLDLTGGHDSSDDLERGGIELSMANLEVLK